jgi:hypothetical protein
MQHPNTAWGIDHIAIAAEAPDSLAWEVARVVDGVPQKLAAGAASVPTGGAPIVYVTPRGAGGALSGRRSLRCGGVRILRSLAQGAQRRGRRALPSRAQRRLRNQGEGLLVPPQEACSVLLILREVPRALGAPD